jgi:spermidine synthase
VKEFPTVERVVAMELVPGVIEAAQRFELENRGILEDPRVELVVADARNHLFGSRERFDVIVGDLFATWHAGTGYLYTTEHFRIVAERLAEGGVFAQWLQADQVSRDELRIITATFLDVFPDAVLWVNTAYQPGPVVIGLVGRRGGGDGPRRESGPAPAVQEFACDPQSLRGWAETSPRNTDDHPIIEFLAAASHARASIEARMEERGELLSLLRELCVGRSS